MDNKPTYFIETDKGSLRVLGTVLLKKLPLLRHTKIWNKDLVEWKNAEDLDELKEVFEDRPPNLKYSPQLPIKQKELAKIIRRVLGFRFSKLSFLLSLLGSLILAATLYVLYQPNKFGDDAIYSINFYLDQQRQKAIYEQQKEERRIKAEKEELGRKSNSITGNEGTLQELYLKTTGENPFENMAIVSIAPAATLPYEYVPDFWDYCEGSQDVFLNVSNISGSFESRKNYLQKKLVLIASFAFIAIFTLSFICQIYLYNRSLSRFNYNHKQ